MRKKKKFMVSAMPWRSYDKEQQLLQLYRYQGWQVRDCSLIGYSFRRVAPADKKILLIMSKEYQSLQRAQTPQWKVICATPLLHVLEGETDAPPFHDAWSAPLARDYRLKSRFWLLLGGSAILVFVALLFVLSTTKLPSGLTNFLFFVLSIIVSVIITSFSRWLWIRFLLSKANGLIRKA